MPTPIKYRITSTPDVPASTTVKGTPLTSAEIDGNFKSLVDSLDAMADSLDAKVDSTDLAAPGGAALVGADTGLTYAAGTVGAMLKSQQSSITTLSDQIAGILDGATFTGPVVLPGNAAAPLQAVPLQQLNAAMAEIPGAVGAYAPAFKQWRDVVLLDPPNDEAFHELTGGVLQASRGGSEWTESGAQPAFKAGAPGFVKITLSGVSISSYSTPGNIRLRVKKNTTYENPEGFLSINENGFFSGTTEMFVIVPVSLGDVLRVGFASGTFQLQTVGANSITFEYFGPVS